MVAYRGLAAIAAPAARHSLDNLYLVAVLADDQVADEDDAGVAEEAAALFGGWVRVSGASIRIGTDHGG
jgi:hypothetical protein